MLYAYVDWIFSFNDDPCYFLGNLRINAFLVFDKYYILRNKAATATLIEEMKRSDINVRTVDDENEHYVIIDRSIVWHGGMNLLGNALTKHGI